MAASDYVKALPESISQWMPRPLIALGTDGYGRSESRASLRDFFEVDAKHIVLATLTGLMRDGKIKRRRGEEGDCRSRNQFREGGSVLVVIARQSA